jgi:DNA-binding HxlR family transcriptional regulator
MAVSEQFKDVFAQLPAGSFDRDCPTRPVMAQVTGRWGALIIAALVPGPMRFSGLHRHIGGISQKMLSQYLKSVVRYGLVERLVEPGAAAVRAAELVQRQHPGAGGRPAALRRCRFPGPVACHGTASRRAIGLLVAV